MRIALIMAASLTAIVSLPALAGEVAGTVYDARGQAVPGVALELAGQQTVTAADGTYAFADVAEGEHRLVAGTQAVAIAVPADGAVRRNLFLVSAAARARVTGEPLPTGNSAQVLADARRSADRLLAEGDQRPARALSDITG